MVGLKNEDDEAGGGDGEVLSVLTVLVWLAESKSAMWEPHAEDEGLVDNGEGGGKAVGMVGGEMTTPLTPGI
jgi:hypothetical protein